MKRPNHVKAPAHLTPSRPLPEPQPVESNPLERLVAPAGEEEKLDPTRYGDWEKKGIAVDF